MDKIEHELELKNLVVVKRDGSEEKFQAEKIENAIEKAFESAKEKLDPYVAKNVLWDIKLTEFKDNKIDIEWIQDNIEEKLSTQHYAVMKKFMLYRYLHKLQREKVMEQGTTYIDCNETIDEYVGKTDWRIKANSNTGYSHAGLINNLAGKVIANYWLDKILTKKQGQLHRDGYIHIHDLDCLSPYCCGHSLRALLDEGFNGVRGRVDSKAPKHLAGALGQMVNYIGCFTGDTTVMLSDGRELPIEEMAKSNQKEWEVKSYNPYEDKVIDVKMDNIHITRYVDELIELEFDDGDIVKCTPDHKFYTLNRGWVEAQELDEEDYLPKLYKTRFFVYRLNNKITGEFYIGQHVSHTINDDYMGSGSKIAENVEKYGKENFEREILEECKTFEELVEREHFYITKYKGDVKCLNINTGKNWGFYSINKNDVPKYYDSLMCGTPIYYKQRLVYVIGDDRVKEILDDGGKVIDVNVVMTDGIRDYIPENYKESIYGLKKGSQFNIKTPAAMLGKGNKDSYIIKNIREDEEFKKENYKKTSKALRRKENNGRSVASNALLKICPNGLTKAQNVTNQQIKRGTQSFVNKETNPNYTILPNGNSIPRETNIKRLKEGNHNFLQTREIGCHNRVMDKRVPQVLEFYKKHKLDISQEVSEEIYKDFIEEYPDWTGKFCLEGMKYTVSRMLNENSAYYYKNREGC